MDRYLEDFDKYDLRLNWNKMNNKTEYIVSMRHNEIE